MDRSARGWAYTAGRKRRSGDLASRFRSTHPEQLSRRRGRTSQPPRVRAGSRSGAGRVARADRTALLTDGCRTRCVRGGPSARRSPPCGGGTNPPGPRSPPGRSTTGIFRSPPRQADARLARHLASAPPSPRHRLTGSGPTVRSWLRHCSPVPSWAFPCIRPAASPRRIARLRHGSRLTSPPADRRRSCSRALRSAHAHARAATRPYGSSPASPTRSPALPSPRCAPRHSPRSARRSPCQQHACIHIRDSRLSAERHRQVQLLVNDLQRLGDSRLA